MGSKRELPVIGIGENKLRTGRRNTEVTGKTGKGRKTDHIPNIWVTSWKTIKRHPFFLFYYFSLQALKIVEKATKPFYASKYIASASYFIRTEDCIGVRRWSMENMVEEFQIYGDPTQLSQRLFSTDYRKWNICIGFLLTRSLLEEWKKIIQ